MNTTLFSIRLLHSPHSLLHSLSRVFFVVCALFTATASKAEAEFTFTLIADSAGAFRDFDTSSFSLNVSGTVAFFAFLNTGRCGIFTGNGATTTTVVLNPMQLGGYGSPSVNQAGMVVFSDRQGNAIRPQRIVSGNGGALTTIADTVGEFEGFTVGYSTSINSAGTVAFWAVPDTGPAGIFASSGGTVTPLFLNSVSLGVSNNFAFNDAGTLAFRKSNATGIVTVTGGAITTIVDSSGPLNYFGSAPSLNETGTVAFVAGVGGIDGGAFGIYKGNGGPLTTIADLSGPYSYLGGFGSYEPSINASGTVAFSAGLDAGGGGVFIGDGTVTSKVVGVGDSLFGSIVTGAGVSPHSLNDSGQVAFTYTLANGVRGIAIANPVPEPSPALLVALSLGLSLARRTTWKY